MPEQKLVAGSWVLALSLILTGCNLETDIPSPDKNNGNQPSEELLEPGENEALLYYKRTDESYSGWGLHLWNDAAAGCDGLAEGVATEWSSPRLPDGISDTYGAYFFIPMREAGNCLNFIVHKDNEKDIGGVDHRWHFDDLGNRIFTLSGSAELSSTPIEAAALAITGAQAHWLDETTLVFKDAAAFNRVELRYDGRATININPNTESLIGGKVVSLSATTLSENLKDQFPHLKDWPAYEVNADTATIKQALKGQLVASAYDSNDELRLATQVQIPGVLDDLYAYDGALGATVNGDNVDFAVWAPTAHRVRLHAFDTSGNTLSGYPVTMTNTDGVWRHSGDTALLDRQYYQYEITVYHPRSEAIENTLVSDPYALSLSTNGQYAQVVDLDDASLQPLGWDTLTPPPMSAPEDVVVYETHIRDFSATDETVSSELRGKYKAFTLPSDGSVDSVAHLKAMADSGVTHLHLLPAFDIATVNEDTSGTVDIDDPFSQLCDLSAQAASEYASHCESSETIRSVLASYDPMSGDAQALYNTFRDLDSFNWGYDPVHYTVPEGSYATDPAGAQRVLEFREMVKAATDLGLNVVMDVVYNHTKASGLANKSVLDKLVPGYYHRQNPETGAVENSTCCENTASEHRMMEKLMIDSLVTWAEHYKISGFRFDLMGHHMLSNMEKALQAVRAVDPDAYFYGEAWNFGEVANNARGINAIQPNMAGTGIGSFNDRLRDAVRGGGPFDSEEAIRANQGFGNGLFTYPNDMNSGAATEKNRLLETTDWIRVGIAGSLQGYSFETADGTLKTAADIDYNGQNAGYTDDPQEIVNYVSKHDNQTLWDNNQYKTAYAATVNERAQMQVVGLSIPILSQGVPFLHMGSELLRSKSMERDSYDSGDWFNEVDFSYQSSAWNRGLPRQDKDGANWPLIQDVILGAGTNANPTPEAIQYTNTQVQKLLTVRKNSPLFRLQTATDIQERLQFLNTGPSQIPGLVAFSLLDDGSNGLADLDGANDELVVLINSSAQAQTLATELSGTFSVLAETSPTPGASTSGGEFTVPALSVAIYAR
ncbi:pullulanase-type alpha-1,6-glucosidase [uncultured Marinobacter sp.]|uniref:pullulanase-type alpha-1,6-glucosidase n=1 Tax=uncultured Marinobacter sp. TaxID=187379 RepID=UPI0026397A60|nr:pullulanase-type alpha-1,6-glucosidase [uncultured Marinobacter sp.]